MALKITQVRGLVGTKPSQRKNIEALGLKRIHHSVIKPDNAAVRGQIQMVAHLVTVEEVAGE
ncbi:50S ribosomal protein L30 [Corynebacterium renale]|uniref:Large ribosomal subunit protein uL30 n=1 Tax=Corynebacterium renale TaxID=1724 RepID=A0A2A9DKU1_9CORY|nr:50S ribosomal protein L30 [Corynebacterium renale]PFG27214.1 large subunit ribosomal protein L30 [Corynebacterium renale]SQG64054.1 50S ribosomal protein L30 [Corynebacterium renale]SQI23763.1 50S ribosomal protein L30 [Corynebacterium renale]STD03834.1 50S ribosomal protein L30 [Corynebacterium renale]